MKKVYIVYSVGLPTGYNYEPSCTENKSIAQAWYEESVGWIVMEIGEAYRTGVRMVTVNVPE